MSATLAFHSFDSTLPQNAIAHANEHGLYRSNNEHDACGVGFIAHLKGQKTHSVVQQGLQILINLDHRGAVGADALMGDGAGILLQIPDVFFREELAKTSITLPPAGEYGVGMVFLPKEHASRLACEQALERAVRSEGQVVLGWRTVPVDANMEMSPTVRAKEPIIRQIFIGRGADIMVTDALERKLYVIRKTASHAIQDLGLAHGREYFVPSMSARTIVYKGLLLCEQVGQYYQDLCDERVVSALALVHQRFSTNTFPEWPLAHPYRLIAHNGEINTVKGNYNWLRAREGVMQSAVLGEDLQKLYPIVYAGQSDTATFDNCLELLLMSGYPIEHAMMMMIPEAWEQHTLMDESRRAFYEYHAAMMEPWDGPSAIVFTDGRKIGATLDRNGLRPARYCVTDDDMVILASEAGVLPIPDNRIKQKWRLQPGKMFLIDLEQGRIIQDEELKAQLSNNKPYKQWIKAIRIKLSELSLPQTSHTPHEHTLKPIDLLDQQQAFGFTQEDLKFLLAPMASNAEEAIGSMGNDSPLAVLSSKNKPFYHYFKQLFAQVTNPPIDSIRESMVMSLVSFIGPRPNLLDIHNVNPPLRLEVSQPILDLTGMAQLHDIENLTAGKFKSHTLDITYPVAWGKEGIEAHLASLCAHAVDAVKRGNNVLIISDRAMDAQHVAIPALLATSAIHQHLIDAGFRTNTGLVVETGSAREVHHFALLAGYGAEAIHPFLAMETISELCKDLPGELSTDKAVQNYIKAVGKGLYKVMSKMGISTYMSYCGAQIFEAIGLHDSLMKKYFKGTASQISGITIFDVAEEALRVHRAAFGNDPILVNALDTGGEYAWRVRGEDHMWTPDSIAKLQQSTKANNYATYKDYAKEINDQSRRHMTLRGLFEFKFDACTAIPLDEVEPAKNIVKRFATGAMSLGSISTEAHTTLAVAMNRLGGKSNTGEGGEDPLRYRTEMRTGHANIQDGDSIASVIGRDRVVADIPLKAGDNLRSRIKQVASARFGVNAEYLSSADQIQIKMAQGAKPGEGGQLPGSKVSEYIGALRFSVPGVGLISPPPHHDIYSIEDLSQLIHDLKNVNSRADISVKLVSEIGVGTVAAGVAKAKADHVVIAGHDGGTGASPLSSVKHCGTPWELGLAETQQTLVLNGLRSRITVQADGQMKTGRDVAIAALLGAEEMGFATAPLVVQGCIMMRKCHLNTCPVGVATQDPVLRAKFQGKPEHVVNFFFFVAEELREIMAKLGMRTFDDLIGRSDLLDMRQGITHWKAQGLDFSRVFYTPQSHNHEPAQRIKTISQDHGLDKALDNHLIKHAQPVLEAPSNSGKTVHFTGVVSNVNRSVGAMLSGEVVRRFGDAGLIKDSIHIELHGTGGQSFGAFLAQGITLDLVGQCNDYAGKGLSGGRLIVRVAPEFRGAPENNIIVGNTVMYGATRGVGFFNGVAGERFAVRNSGATAVVEGTGDHGCEYMTGGTVVVLGLTGRNFAAGMSGGIAYVYDVDGLFAKRCNTSMVNIETLSPANEQRNTTQYHNDQPDETQLKALIKAHFAATHSPRARLILEHWKVARTQFVKVFPSEYSKALKAMHAVKASSSAAAFTVEA
jgi:glutamate synthase (NADPH) large chain